MRTLGGRYQLEAPLGRGGMAVVWRGYDKVLSRPVAVKLVAPRLADRLSRERIRAEAQAAARLAHPNVASVYDFGESGLAPGRRVPYIVMELVEADTLATRMQAEPLHWRTTVAVLAEVAAALAAAHACGIVHRDIKPGNIMLARTGVKVVDFGIAAAVGDIEDTNGDLLGTPAYVAPERMAGDPAVPATDVYALGVILHQCLAGGLPWLAGTVSQLVTAHRDHPPAALPPIDGLPAEVVELHSQCLSKDPNDRPTSLYAALVLAEAAGLAVTLPTLAEDRPAPAGSIDGPLSGPAPRSRGSDDAVTAPVRRRSRSRPSAWSLSRDRMSRTVDSLGLWVTRGRSGSGLTAPAHRSAADDSRTRVPLASSPGHQPRPGLRPADHQRRARWELTSRRRLVAVAGLAAVVAAAATSQVLSPRHPAPNLGTAAAPQHRCAARYVAEHGRSGAFTAEVAVTNTGADALVDWSLGFALPGGQRVTAASGARWDQQGEAVTLRGDKPLGVGDTLRFALTGTAGTVAAKPSRFTLDGAPCAPAITDVRRAAPAGPGSTRQFPAAPVGVRA